MIFKRILLAGTAIFLYILSANGQQVANYNLVQLLKANMLDTASNHQQTYISDSSQYQAVNVKGITWLKGVTFSEGTIDVDLRGKNVLFRSFIGIAFHGKDTTTYEAIYFCPFRFHDASPVTRKYSVKYISLPGNDYQALRQLYPGVYENEVTPAPNADEWFHATIVVKDGWITTYVNHSATPSLKVKKIGLLTEGEIGLWSNESVNLPSLTGDFANLSIAK